MRRTLNIPSRAGNINLERFKKLHALGIKRHLRIQQHLILWTSAYSDTHSCLFWVHNKHMKWLVHKIRVVTAGSLSSNADRIQWRCCQGIDIQMTADKDNRSALLQSGSEIEAKVKMWVKGHYICLMAHLQLMVWYYDEKRSFFWDFSMFNRSAKPLINRPESVGAVLELTARWLTEPHSWNKSRTNLW